MVKYLKSFLVLCSVLFPKSPYAAQADSADAAFIASLPDLDSLLADQQQTELLESSVKHEPKEASDISASGTAFRSMDMSPLAGSDLGGGLKLQLNGNLTENIQVSGILSDQSSPIQPRGDTRKIRDLDEVYVKVTHPNISVTAGDYFLKMNSGKLLNINKNLIGIKSSFKYNNVIGSAFFAGAKGNYREFRIKGEEGNQGPYMLASGGDFRNQTIVAGSETVWLDGMQLTRGNQYDYTIDYSTGELTFEPKHLLHSDSDIVVEFESTDSKYRRNTAGSSLSLKKEGSFLEVNWIRDFDDPSLSGSAYASSDLELIKTAGDEHISVTGAVEDSAGMYVFEDNIFVYDPDAMMTGKRFMVSFSLDRESGAYKRDISADGTLYYSFVPKESRSGYVDLYDPGKTLDKPENISLIHVRSGIPLSQNQMLQVHAGISQFDQNRLSAIGDKDNTGSIFQLALEGNGINLGRGFGLDYAVSAFQKGSRYQPMERDQHVSFERNWNITGAESGKEILSDISGKLQLPSGGILSSSYAHYSVGNLQRERIQSGLESSSRWLPELKASFSSVKGERDFIQRSFFVKMLPGSIHPFVNLKSETRTLEDKWGEFSGGLEFGKGNNSMKFSVGQRDDYVYSFENAHMGQISEAVFGSLDISRRTERGWSGEMQIRKRITQNSIQESKTDISLAHIRSHFRRNNHPIRFDIKLKRESRLGSGRIMVYDSVGAGLGGFRYDEEFDTFIEDPNGAYVGFAVASGIRRPVKAVGLTELFEVDFSKTTYMKLDGIKLRINLSADLSGSAGDPTDWMFAALENESIERSRWMARTEISYRPVSGHRQQTISWVSRRDLNALDLRGTDISEHREASAEWKESLRRHFRWTMKGIVSDHDAASTVSSFRNRTSEGQWLESGFEWNVRPDLEVIAHIQGGVDRGVHRNDSYSGKAMGLHASVIKRIGLIGRIRGEITLNESWMDEAASASLPPEALQGFALGKTFRMQITTHFLFKNAMSMNLSVNTISDARYENLINLRGEIRANF